MGLTLVVMAAGAGSRFGGPKQMMPIGPSGEWLLDFGVQDARRAGFDRVVLVIREELTPDFEQHFEQTEPTLDVTLVTQRLDDAPVAASWPSRVKMWGTGHALLSARATVDGPFAIMNADDFYGARAYEIAAEACAAAAGSGAAAVVGMRLDRTLSPHGPVTRGWCQVRDGHVQQIEEVLEIERRDGRLTGRGRSGPIDFDGTEMVSMNFWVFPPSIFRLVGARFEAFLAREGHDPDAEFLLPEAVNELVASGELAVLGIEAPGPWFGLTYRDDLPAVTAGIGELIAEGHYRA